MRVPAGVRVLDVGCGFGQALGYHRARGCDAHGTEMDLNAQTVATTHGLNIRPGALRAEDWEEHSFDYVTLDQVIEHLYDPAIMLRDIRRLLKPNGRLIFTTPNGRGLGASVFGRRWIHWHAPYHVRLYTRKSLNLILDKAGFTLKKIDTVTATPWLQYQIIHLGTCPPEGVKSPFWDPRSTMAESKNGQKARHAADVMNRFKLTPFVTRLVDSFGLGDNIVGEAIVKP